MVWQKKAKHKKFFQTAEGEKVIDDFSAASYFFDDHVRVGKQFFYINDSDFYPLHNVELFKLVKKEKEIVLYYKNKNESEKILKSFGKEAWEKNKKDVIRFLEKMKDEHPEIKLEVL